MKEKLNQILNSFKEEISLVDSLDYIDFKNLEIGFRISRAHLQKLRFLLREEKFESEEQEIKFFKEQKPYIYGRLKFYAKLYNFNLNRPVGTIKSQRNFIDNEIDALQKFYGKHLEFVKYYRNNQTFLDSFYFVRGKDDLNLIPDTSHFYTDEEFSTSHDNSVAKIIAYDLLLTHYSEEIDNLRNKPSRSNNSVKRHFKTLDLGWTANKIDLIELIYALQASGAIRGGKAGIKEMAMACEQIFDLDLGNYYRKFLEIRARKIEPTKFLDRLKTALEKRMEDADE